jgi:hypothetical protein
MLLVDDVETKRYVVGLVEVRKTAVSMYGSNKAMIVLEA